MKKHLLVLSFLFTSALVFLPIQGSAAIVTDPAAVIKSSRPQIHVQIGRGRGHHRGWYRGRHVGRYYRSGYYGHVFYDFQILDARWDRWRVADGTSPNCSR